MYRGRHYRHSRVSRQSQREETYKAPGIMEPGVVDFSKYGLVAQIWMEQVDPATVLKSKTMYLTIMPPDAKLPDEITKTLAYVPTGDDLTQPPQWIIARGRSIRRRKRQIDENHQRMSESFGFYPNMSTADSDLDLSRTARPMSPGRQSLLFFRIGGRWQELAWVLFEGAQSDAETIRMVKDIQLKNTGKLTDQIHDMMARWWKTKGHAATIEELRRALDLINLPCVQDETFNPKAVDSFFPGSDDRRGLECREIEVADPDVSRLLQEYNQRSHNSSFAALDPASTPAVATFGSDSLLRQTQEKNLLLHSTPNLRLSKSSDSRDMSLGRNDSRDGGGGSFARLHSRNGSFRLFSSQDSLNMDNTGDDNKRKSFQIVQPKLKGKDFRHESNI